MRLKLQCDRCGSQNIEMRLQVWVPVNTDMDLDTPADIDWEGEPAEYWCKECEDSTFVVPAAQAVTDFTPSQEPTA